MLLVTTIAGQEQQEIDNSLEDVSGDDPLHFSDSDIQRVLDVFQRLRGTPVNLDARNIFVIEHVNTLTRMGRDERIYSISLTPRLINNLPEFLKKLTRCFSMLN